MDLRCEAQHGCSKKMNYTATVQQFFPARFD